MKPFLWASLLLGSVLLTSCDRLISNGFGQWSVSRSGGSSVVTASGDLPFNITHLAHNNQVYFVLISKGTTEGEAVTPGARTSGTLNRVGRHSGGLTWNCQTSNGKTGAVTIAHQSFALEQGAVFLVDARTEPPKVKQVVADMPQLQTLAQDSSYPINITQGAFQALAPSNASLIAFLKDFESAK